MSRFLFLWVAVLSLALAVTGARARDYFVASQGSDGAPGTSDQPWQTIQMAANSLRPGDTVFVHAGTYGPVTLHVSGSAAGRVTFTNVPGELSVIDATGLTPPADDTALFLIPECSYVSVSGFEMRNYRTNDPSLVPSGIFLRGACHHVQIRNCNIHHIENTGGDIAQAGNAFGSLFTAAAEARPLISSSTETTSTI